MADQPIYKGYAPGKKPPLAKQPSKPIILPSVEKNTPMTEEDRQAFYKMSNAEKMSYISQRQKGFKTDADYFPKNPLQNVHVMNQARDMNVSIYPTLPGMGANGWEYQKQNTNRPIGFWENPQRIARFKDYIDANPDAVLPTWLDKDVINSAYSYLQYANHNKPVQEWGVLTDQDPITDALRSLPEPENPRAIDPLVTDYDLEKTVNPEDLTAYQRALYGFMSPQPGKFSVGAVAQTGLSALGTGGGTSFVLQKLTGLLQTIGITKNPAMFAQPAGIAGAVIFGSATWWQMQTGEELGAVNTLRWLVAPPGLRLTKLGKQIDQKVIDIIDSKPGLREWLEQYNPIQFKYGQEAIAKAFNVFSEMVAGVLGVVAQATSGDEDFSEVAKNLGAAYKAGKLSYVAYGKTKNPLLPLSEGKPLEEGKMWDISSGENKPVDIPSGFTVEATALDRLRNQIVSDPDNYKKYKQEFITRFGVEGQLNDFVLQTLLDPMNAAPYTNAKLVEFAGKKTNNPAMQYAGKFSQGNPVVDAIPFPFNAGVELLSGGRLQGSKGFVGAMDAYKNFINGNIPANMKGKIPYKAPADYTRLEKLIGGLNEDGVPKNLSPQDFSKKAVENASELMPDAKALLWSYTLTDRLYFLWDYSGKDVDAFLKLVQASSQADPKLVKEQIASIFNESGLPEDYMDARQFNSPIAAALATGLKKAVDSGDMSMIVQKFQATAENRMNLQRYASFFGTTDAKLIKDYKDGKINYDNLIKQLSLDPMKAEIAKVLFPNGDSTMFKIDMDIFSKGNTAYNDSMLGLEIINHINNSLDDFVINRFGIKMDDPLWMRLNHTMKGLQSLALLSMNPRYFIYNTMNNMITRIASNNYGYTDFKKFVDTYEPFVSRQDIEGGLSQDLLNNANVLLKGKNQKAKGSAVLERGVDKITRKLGDVLGFATKASRWNEKFESRQSFAIEYINAFGKIRRVELPAELMRNLPEGISGRVAKIIEGATKTTDLDNVWTHISDPVIAKEVIDSVLSDFANSNDKMAVTADMYKDTLIKTGIYDEIVDGLKNVKSIRDIADVFDNIDNHFQDYLNKLTQNDIETRIPDVANRVKAEGLPAALSMFSDMTMMREATIAGKWQALDNLFALRGVVDDAVWHKMFDSQMKANQAEFTRQSQWQEATYEGLLDALGKSDLPEAKAFLSSFKAGNDNFSSFFNEKMRLWQEHADRTKTLTQEARNIDYKATEATVDALWKQTTEKDFALQSEADRAFIALSGGDPKVVVWRGELGKIRLKINSEMSTFRASLKEFTTMTIAQKNQLYNKFITETYMDLQRQYKDLEMDGAHGLRNDTQVQNSILGKETRDLNWKDIPSNNPEFSAFLDKYLPEQEGVQRLPFGRSETVDIVSKQTGRNIVDIGNASEAETSIVLRAILANNNDIPQGVDIIFGHGTGTGDTWRFVNGENVYDVVARLSPNKKAFVIACDDTNKRNFGTAQGVMVDGVNRSFTDVQPLGTTPSTLNQGEVMGEGSNLFLVSLLGSLRQKAIDDFNTPRAKEGIPQEAIPAFKKFIAQEKQNLASDKLFAQTWAESQRDFVMLNYTKKTNFDNTLSTIFPYQFWYTNTMRNWALRMIDRPAIFNQYFRYRQAQENLQKAGIPARLEGKMSAFAPYLPDWMGDTLWSDPMGQIYPFSQALQPFKNIMGLQEDLTTSAGYILNDMVKAGKISKAEATEAKTKMSGDLWNQAMAQATDESALSDPSSMVGLMMQPGMHWDILSKLVTGNQDKISPTPAYRTGQAIEQLGTYAGVNAKPLTWLETNARKAIGMSQSVAKYGQFGDYYVERMLSNMAFEGTISSKEAREAMVTHAGSAWEQADKRVMEEITLKQPGMLPVVGAINGANFWQISSATFKSLFPQGLLPQGELIYKGQQQEYNLAWEKYNAGDKSALSDFYNEHPEYKTRSALYTKDPEARMKQYIISDIWDSYGASGSANKSLLRDALGEDFEKAFLQGSAETQSAIPLETLIIWSRKIGNTIPKPEAMPDFSAPEGVTNIELWSKDIATSYDQYVKEREAMFPLYYSLQTAFFDLPKSEQSAFLKSNPSLKEYWDWKEKYEIDHPELSPVFASQQMVDVSKNPDVTLKGFDPELLKQLNDYYSGIQMTSGAWEMLGYEWEQLGRPYGTLKKWMSKVIEPAITGKSVPQDSFWTDGNSAVYGAYKQELESRYPTYSSLNETYWNLPKNQRDAFVDANPVLQEAWDWKEDYLSSHPEVRSILEYISSKYGN